MSITHSCPQPSLTNLDSTIHNVPSLTKRLILLATLALILSLDKTLLWSGPTQLSLQHLPRKDQGAGYMHTALLMDHNFIYNPDFPEGTFSHPAILWGPGLITLLLSLYPILFFRPFWPHPSWELVTLPFLL